MPHAGKHTEEIMDYWISTLIIGIGATLVMDIWGFIRQPLLGIAPPDYRMVGRWIGHMRHGKFHHVSITKAQAVRGEHWVGWCAHYATGIAFAAIVTGIWGMAWVARPTLAPALIVGIATVTAPFLLMQPGMGAGIAASRTPRPGMARLQSLITHAVFGLGLYAGGWIAHVLVASR
jgi:hypothetical protein